MPSPQYTLLFLLTTTSGSVIATQEHAYPEVVPGPGLPSLASLGLTTADLYNMPLPSASLPSIVTANARRPFSNTCGPADNAYTNVNNLIACYYYLSALTGWRCNIKGGSGYLPNNWCQTGEAWVFGQSYTERDGWSLWWAIHFLVFTSYRVPKLRHKFYMRSSQKRHADVWC
jgi:hypothetical protein